VNQLVQGVGYDGIHWSRRDGSEAVVVYDGRFLSPPKVISQQTPYEEEDPNWPGMKFTNTRWSEPGA
jgi:hypothetical protein